MAWTVKGIDTAFRPSGISAKIIRKSGENMAGFTHQIKLMLESTITKPVQEYPNKVFSLQLRSENRGIKFLCKNPYPGNSDEAFLIANQDGTAWFTGPTAQCCQLYWMEHCGIITLASKI